MFFQLCYIYIGATMYLKKTVT